MTLMFDRLISLMSPTIRFAQYAVASYTPDLRRFESHNIGVFVWMPGLIKAKFLPSECAAEFVGDLAMYNRWIRFWNDKISADEFEHRDHRTPKDSPLYLDTLLGTQKGSYRLRLANEMLSEIQPDRLDRAVDQLFNELVLPQSSTIERFAEPPSERYTIR